MDKIDALLAAIQLELKQHEWTHFSEVIDSGQKVTVPGCAVCRKHIGTTTQFIEHLAEDAMPALFARLRKKKPDGA
jgi:hypothetical protein